MKIRPLRAPADVNAMDPLDAAILRVLAYHDLFRHPLTVEEIRQSLSLPGVATAALTVALHRLGDLGLLQSHSGTFFALTDVVNRVQQRKAMNERAAAAMPQAVALGRGLMRLPFVRAVAISGSLSKGVLGEDGDFDYFVITHPGRLWIVRSLIRLRSRLLPDPELLCANYLIDGAALELTQRDAFTAIELMSLIPVAGHKHIRALRAHNDWALGDLPNAVPAQPVAETPLRPAITTRLAEALLAGVIGDALERLLLLVTRLWVRRCVPDFAVLERRGALLLTPRVAKIHTKDWRNRTLRRFQDSLDRMERQGGMSIDRGVEARNLVVASSFFYRFDEKQWRTAQPYPPLGTLYAAGVAQAAGFDVSLFDAGLAESEQGFVSLIDEKRPGIVVLYEDGFNYLTKMCLTRMREAALGMVALARARGAKVVVCSSDATDHAGRYLAAGAHAVIAGEGEESLRDVLEAWRHGGSLDGIPGIIHVPAAVERASAALVANGRRPVLRDLDSLARPAWDLVDMEAYRRIWRRAHGYFSLNISTTRGCPYRCNWCAKPIYGNRYNSRSPESVVAEIADLIATYQPDHFWITDDIFGLKPGWIKRFAELVRERGLRFRYTIQSRADLLSKADMLEDLAASGLDTVWIGAESGSQRILDAMDKEIRRDQIDALVPHIRALGMRSALFLQFGYPGETKADIEQTIDMVTRLMPDQIGISVSYPLPGTVFYDRVRAALGEKTNWTDSDDLDLMFPGAYSPGFYRRLHRYVHRRFAVARALKVLAGDLPERRTGGRLRGLLTLARHALPLTIGTLRLRLERPRADAPRLATPAEAKS